MRKKLCLLIVFLSIATLAFAQGESEQLTITTYYPSPYGVYKSLRLFPYNAAPPTCDGSSGGLQYFSGTYNTAPISANTMYYCNGTQWVSMGGGGGVSYTHYCYYVLSYGNPVCPASVSIGTQGPCDAGFTVQKSLGPWGYCHNNGFDYFLPPGGNGCPPAGSTCTSGCIMGEAYVCSQ